MNASPIIFENGHPNNGLVLLLEVPPAVINDLRTAVRKLQSHKFAKKLTNVSHQLAGQISEQLSLIQHESFRNFLDSVILHYKNLSELTGNVEYTDMWVNLQKKYEYNPNHTHSGTLSFVIWLDIPYIFAEEDVLITSAKSSLPSNGRFEFTYITNSLNINVHRVEADKKFEGKMLIFKSSLRHCVYPFYTSDDYRISIAGNVYIK